MVIRVFTSHLSANNSIRNQQRHILDLLQAKNIEFEEIDISNPANEDRKSFMQENCPPTSNGKPPLPPQIFADDTYCGGYDDFSDAVEGDQLWSFLHLPVPPEEEIARMKKNSKTQTEAKAAADSVVNGNNQNNNGNV